MIENVINERKKNKKKDENISRTETESILTRRKNIVSLIVFISSFVILSLYSILLYFFLDVEKPLIQNTLKKLNISISQNNTTKTK